MVYTDRPAITFWSDYLRTKESSQNQPDQEPTEDPQLESQEMAKTWFLKLRKEFPLQMRQVRLSHSFSDKSRIIVKESGYPRLWQRFVQFARDYEHHDFTQDRLLACGMRDWGKSPFGAAAHGWLPGVMSWKHIEFLEAFSLNLDALRNKEYSRLRGSIFRLPGLYRRLASIGETRSTQHGETGKVHWLR